MVPAPRGGTTGQHRPGLNGFSPTPPLPEPGDKPPAPRPGKGQPTPGPALPPPSGAATHRRGSRTGDAAPATAPGRAGQRPLPARRRLGARRFRRRRVVLRGRLPTAVGRRGSRARGAVAAMASDRAGWRPLPARRCPGARGLPSSHGRSSGAAFRRCRPARVARQGRRSRLLGAMSLPRRLRVEPGSGFRQAAAPGARGFRRRTVALRGVAARRRRPLRLARQRHAHLRPRGGPAPADGSTPRPGMSSPSPSAPPRPDRRFGQWRCPAVKPEAGVSPVREGAGWGQAARSCPLLDAPPGRQPQRAAGGRGVPGSGRGGVGKRRWVREATLGWGPTCGDRRGTLGPYQ